MNQLKTISTFRMIFSRVPLWLTALLMMSCGGSDLGAGFEELPHKTADQVATGAAGVSSAHPLASQAGAQMLHNGGNAADAAVATGFALTVVENSMNGLGGRMQILLRQANGELHGIDAQTQVGSNYKAPWFLPAFNGVEIVGVPGVVAGLLDLHETHGSLPLEQVMAPAIGFAREGYPILPGEVSRHLRVEEQVRADATLAAVYLDESQSIRSPGELFRQPDLANTLEVIQNGGKDAFYNGDIARKVTADLQARGGGVTYEDFAGYESTDATIVRGTYRGYEVIGTTAPANGTAVVAALNVLSHFDMGALPESEWARVISQTMAQVMQATVMDDPDDEQYKDTISAERVCAYLQAIDPPITPAAAHRQTRKVLTPQAQSAGMQVSQVDWSGAANGDHSHHTTHHVAADANGMMVSITQTLGPNFGAKVMTPGLGFLHAQTGGMPSWLADTGPGDRPRTNIAPIILLKDGEPVMAIGAAGGLIIPPALVQVISRVVDQGYSLAEAIAAPRIAPKLSLITASFLMDEATLEMTPTNGWTQDEAAAIEAAGIEVTRKQKYSLLARVNGIMRDRHSGLWTAVADPDWEGSAAMAPMNSSGSDEQPSGSTQ